MIPTRKIIQSDYFAKSLLIISVTLFIMGVSFPIFTSTKFFFWKDDISLLKSVQLLFEDKSYFLAFIILIFTFLFPIFKYSLLLMLTFNFSLNRRNLILKYLNLIGKWSMLDVFVIALLILLFKLKSGLFSIELKMGTIFFALAVLTSILYSTLMKIKS